MPRSRARSPASEDDGHSDRSKSPVRERSPRSDYSDASDSDASLDHGRRRDIDSEDEPPSPSPQRSHKKKKKKRSGSPPPKSSSRSRSKRPKDTRREHHNRPLIPHHPMMGPGAYFPYPPPHGMPGHPHPGMIHPPPPFRPKRSFEGFIFGCNGSTFDECMQRQLFGGPRKLMPLVAQITPHDTPLFLFHHTNRTLYGVFEATSPGMENIEPRAWTRHGTTSFSAQVKFRYKFKFSWPLPEAKWSSLVKYHSGKPAPQLNKQQVRRLIEAFADNDARTAHRAGQQLIQFFNL